LTTIFDHIRLRVALVSKRSDMLVGNLKQIIEAPMIGFSYAPTWCSLVHSLLRK